MIAAARSISNHSLLARRLARLEDTFLRSYRGRIAIALVAMLMQSLLLLPLPLLQGCIIDRLVEIAGSKNEPISLGWVFTCAVAIPLACVLGRLALSWFSSGQMNDVSLQFVRALT